jgi:ankyrin repeat protein
LQLAVITSRDETAVLLVERGADLSRRNAQGVTALDIAAGRNDFDLAAAMEEAEARR